MTPSSRTLLASKVLLDDETCFILHDEVTLIMLLKNQCWDLVGSLVRLISLNMLPVRIKYDRQAASFVRILKKEQAPEDAKLQSHGCTCTCGRAAIQFEIPIF